MMLLLRLKSKLQFITEIGDEKLNIKEIKDRDPLLVKQLLEIWEDSVKATHLFLTNEEIKNIREYVPQKLKGVSHLVIIENENNTPVAFMGVEDRKLEMLFVRNSERGNGLGKKLLNYGIEIYNVNELTVNEQNHLALGFYEYMGFKIYKRLELDEQGNHYPIIYMKLER